MRVQFSIPEWIRSRLPRAFSAMRAGQILGIFSLVFAVFLAFESMTQTWFVTSEAPALGFRFGADPASQWSPQEVQARLQGLEPVRELLSDLHTYPFWLLIDLPAVPYSDAVMAFNTRHLYSSNCWQLSPNGQLYEFWSTHEEPSYIHYQGGKWILRLQELGLKGAILCKMQFVGPARLTLNLLPENLLLSSESSKSEKRKGFLEGSLVLLIAAVTVISILGQSSLFLVYGFWLFFSLRLAMIFEGWDHEFFGFEVPLELLPEARKWVLSLYYSSTSLLAVFLFDNLRRPGWSWAVRGAWMSSGAFVVLSLTVSYGTFLQVYWPLSLFSVAALLGAVVQLVFERRSTMSLYFLLALVFTFTGVVLELLNVWFNWSWHALSFNSASITMATSLMTAVLLAERFSKLQEQKRVVNQSLNVATQRLDRVFHMAPSAMFSASPRGKLLGYNSRFRQDFLSPELEPIYPFLESRDLSSLFYDTHTGLTPKRWELVLNLSHGKQRWFELIVSRDDTVLTGVIEDITLQKQRELELEHQASHDELTGALNRRGFEHLVMQELDQDCAQLILYAVDIRRFSRLSVVYGAPLANRVLKSCFEYLDQHLHQWGELARFGVDQFVLFISPDHPEFKPLVARLGEDVHPAQDPLLEGRHTPQLTIDQYVLELQLQTCMLSLNRSLEVQEVFESIEEIFRRSSTMGARHVRFGAQEIQSCLEQTRIQRSLSLRQLPENLVLLWQPIVNLNQPLLGVYAEALLRLRGSNGHYACAQELIQSCMASGQSHFLDEWVLKQVLDYLSAHQLELKALRRINVNISPHSLNNPQFMECVLALLAAHPVAARQVCLEITELGTILNLDAVRQFIEQARTMGASIAIDDFGAGYSNFNMAVDLACDVIKIDGAIVRGLTSNRDNQAVVKAIVGLAHDLGCQCVAEWVEDTETLEMLEALHIDFAQGFLFARAMESARFLNIHSTLDLFQDPRLKGFLLRKLF